jgi:outer membrane protein W
MRNLLKLFIVLLMLGWSVNSFAQATFGIRAGFNLSNMLWEDNDVKYSDEFNFSMKPGFNFGPTLELPISEKISFETALLLSTFGAKAEFDDGEGTTKGSVNLLYLNLPLTVKAKFDVGGIQPFGAFGPYLGYGISGKFKTDGSADEDVSWGSGDNDDFKPFDFGLHFGAGVGIKAFEIGLTYDLGLANIAVSTDNGYKELNRLLAINLGYKFGKK